MLVKFINGNRTNLLLIIVGLATTVGLVFALLVGYSRIYLGVHYVGDVVCGALLGVMLGMIVSGAVIRCLRIRIIHNVYRGGKFAATANGPTAWKSLLPVTLNSFCLVNNKVTNDCRLSVDLINFAV